MAVDDGQRLKFDLVQIAEIPFPATGSRLSRPASRNASASRPSVFDTTRSQDSTSVIYWARWSVMLMSCTVSSAANRNAAKD